MVILIGLHKTDVLQFSVCCCCCCCGVFCFCFLVFFNLKKIFSCCESDPRPSILSQALVCHRIIHKFPHPWHWIYLFFALNNWWDDRVFRLRWAYRENSWARKRETTQYNTAKLSQLRPSIALTLRHRDTSAPEKVVNSVSLPTLFTSILFSWFVKWSKDKALSSKLQRCHRNM